MSMNSCELVPEIGSHEELIVRLKSSSECINYVLLDIDNFANINAAYDYDVGTKVLCQVAKYLTIVKKNNSQLYRYSADRFILINTESSKKELETFCESILSFFSQTELPILKDTTIIVSLSIGVSIDVGLDNIINAELAMKESRISKRNHYIIYDKDTEYVRSQQKNIYWILKIKEAVENENILAYFQPIVNNKTGKIDKYECLARIKDADEIISPYMFMEAARVTGSLSYVTKSLIIQSCKKFANNDLEFSINITQEDLLLGFLEFFLLKNTQKYNIDPSRIVLEMLEQITTLDNEIIIQQLNSLRAKGFKIAIDDFGAENSNMSRLLEIHPDYLKIDGAFIKNIVDDEKSQIIVDAIVFMCKKGGIKIIAEFIHNEAVQAKVKSLGIEYSQGYYFGEPKPDLIGE